MEERRGSSIDVLAERLRGVQDDVAELRQLRKEDHHRLRNNEAAVSNMLEAARIARETQAREYRRMTNVIGVAGLLMAAAMVALTAVTIILHTG